MRVDVEVSKVEFKALYFKYAQPNSGWTKDYWDQYFEPDRGATFFFQEPLIPAERRMMIVSRNNAHRMIFLTEESEESFFQNPAS